jgi:hypothetical protein
MQLYNKGTTMTINTSTCRWKHNIIFDEVCLFSIIKIFFKKHNQVNIIIINNMWLFPTLCESTPENSTINPKIEK